MSSATPLPVDPEGVITVGIDEVGRGSVYGPVVVGACANLRHWHHDEVRDSKKVGKKKRQGLASLIKQNTRTTLQWGHAWLINERMLAGQSFADVIRELMQRCIDQTDHVLSHQRLPVRYVVDGQPLDLFSRVGTIEFMEKGDNNVFAIAAAAIAAKVAHDDWISERVKADPSLGDKYGLKTNAGYGTPPHIRGLAEHGLTDEHRVVFAETAIRRYHEKKT
ncbi:MAG: hypothetical protein AAGD32_17575 [Planctomycetota bacterium]